MEENLHVNYMHTSFVLYFFYCLTIFKINGPYVDYWQTKELSLLLLGESILTVHFLWQIVVAKVGRRFIISSWRVTLLQALEIRLLKLDHAVCSLCMHRFHITKR